MGAGSAVDMSDENALELGGVYWSNGLEAAMMTHTVVYLCLFFAIPALF